MHSVRRRPRHAETSELRLRWSQWFCCKAGTRGLIRQGKASDEEDPVWSQGLIPDPRIFLPPAHRNLQRVWHTSPVGGLFSDEVFVDGSLEHPTDPLRARGG